MQQASTPAATDTHRGAPGDESWVPYTHRLATLRVTEGCTAEPARFCPHQPTTRAQIATFLASVVDLVQYKSHDPKTTTPCENSQIGSSAVGKEQPVVQASEPPELRIPMVCSTR